jgi:hypothetical protein
VVFWLFLAGHSAASSAGGEMLINGAMEGPYSDGLAQGWAKNCYGAHDAVFTEETSDLHGGRSAQRVTCRSFTNGGVQFHSGSVAVEKGKPYTLQLWMKSDLKVPVHVVVRKHGPPYTGYLRRQFRVQNEWTPYLLWGEATDTDPSCSVFIMFAGTGTLLVDDVSLVSGACRQAAVDPASPPRKGNRIYNSGFEAGSEGWTPVGGFKLVDAATHGGRRSARIPAGGIESRPFPVRIGQVYTLTAFIKAASPGTPVRLQMMEWADDGADSPHDRHTCETTVTATTEWKRFQLSANLWPNLWHDYVARILPAATIDLDDVQVEEGAATAYQPAHPLEVGAESPTRWCRVGEAVDVTATVAGGRPAADVRLTYTLEDLWSRPVKTIVHTARAGATDQATFPAERPGMYRVRVRADDSPATGEVCFGVFPRRDRRPRPDSPFATHMTAEAPTPGNAFLAGEAMGARWLRLHDFDDFCHWYRVEPEPGKFVWFDRQINDLTKRGFILLGNLGHTPCWAACRDEKGQVPAPWPNCPWTPKPPRDMPLWENYVARTVEHYKDHIRYWEIWNEPYWTSFFAGTPQQCTEYLAAAYRAIKRAQPEAIVLGGWPRGDTDADPWTKGVLAAGALDFLDGVSYHVYWNSDTTKRSGPAVPPSLTRDMRHLKDLMRQHGRVRPIYMTEGGTICPPFASWLPREGFAQGGNASWLPREGFALDGVEAAGALVRGFTEMLSEGSVLTCYYYTAKAPPWFSSMANAHYGLLDYDGRPKPTAMAYSAMELLLDGARYVRLVERDGLTIHVFGKVSNGRPAAVAVVWSDRRRPISPRGATVLDMMGNEMTEPVLRPDEPVYVCAPAVAPEQFEEVLP